ncbi:MAG TPA: hypothetical protein VN249_07930, partial [Prolixibacteraceae bacterium]|nr:hypothetical protein [Prolixibacteraceae bacterium]
MDKKIWLKVIREELGLLDHLATGMIEDAELSKEEVELAISRSNMVTKEFEMLRSHIPEPLHRREIKEEVRIPAD